MRSSRTRPDASGFCMNVAVAKTETGRALSDVFAVARDRLPGAGKVAEIRRQAFEAYERAGLPHRRIEEWKYTDLRVLMREVLPLAAAPDAAALKRAGAALKSHAIAGVRRAGAGGRRVRAGTVRNRRSGTGRRHRDAARGAGDRRAALQAQLLRPTVDAMVALNSAMMTDGVVIEVADGAVLAKPSRSSMSPAAAAVGHVHALAVEDRQGRARDTGGELYRRRRRARPIRSTMPLIVSVGDEARLDACAPDRGRPRRVQHLVRLVAAGREGEFQHCSA